MFLVLIETSGNQNFIFATNKLKENIGASELTYRVGTQWLSEIIGNITNNSELQKWQDGDSFRKTLLEVKDNPPIENDDSEVEIINAVSGKALLITKKEDTAKDIITQINLKCLQQAPSIDVCGVYVKFDWHNPIQNAVKEVYEKLDEAKSQLLSPQFRFLKLPIIVDCNTSGLPASHLETNPENDKIPLSAGSFAKRNNADDSLQRMNQLIQESSLKFPSNTNDLEKSFTPEWLGIVHADGNGLGQIFLNFYKYANNNRDYIDKLRRFSLALDLCTQNAFQEAIKVFEDDGKRKIKKNKIKKVLPVIPLVLGGDDLTVVCDGKKALEFTQKFLLAFEKETARDNLQDVGNIIKEISEKALQSEGLSACAGIAIVKPHFPFSVGYDLAESLLKSAKTVKNNVQDEANNTVSCSALDFHIVYDSSGVNLKLIRDRLQLRDNTKLYKRPFVITPLNQLDQATELSKQWASFYHWDKFVDKVNLLTKNKQNAQESDKDKDYLPPTQSNALRSAIFVSKEEADARFKLIYQRYKDITKELAESDKSLFQIMPINATKNTSNNVYITSFLDALDAVDFV
ncbi:MAG: hypothetical protein IGQ45_05270 [Cyanobacterium sp. T60_A2020_053]|nr:hypothetical protein [Cyanobacterium sp. T60_A2020_053]